MTLEQCFAELVRHGAVAVSAWPDGEDPAAFGLLVDAGEVRPAVPFDPLSAPRLRAALSARAAGWLRRLSVLPVTGSTNQQLLDLAERESIDGSVCVAELQVRGRGRRGRGWVSPFGANLAISIGFSLAVPATRLGSASLVVGLAVLEALESLGARGLGLKWPNDLLLGDAKVGGILIEVSQRRGPELVVGIGLNVNLPANLRRDLPARVADLCEAGVAGTRSEIAAAVVSSVVDFLGKFELSGFEAFHPAFDARHVCHGQRCDVLLGDQRVAGTVIGVSSAGELMLRTAEGDRSFSAGEVSLRAKP